MPITPTGNAAASMKPAGEHVEQPAPGDVVADKYRIDAVIGEGGMGRVYAATNTLTDKRVALKWMRPRFAQDEHAFARFMREAKTAGRIHHPNVVDVYDVGRDGDTPFLVMELLDGHSASEVIGSSPRPAELVVGVLVPVMRGLAAAHRMGVVHRDLKPDNIFLVRDERGAIRDAKVLDFGISMLSEEGELARVTQTGAVIGTPHYMSPEQVRGHRDVDQRSDVYALGVILYQGLTGTLPFHAEPFTALAVEIATGTPVLPSVRVPDLPTGLEAVVMRALAKDPAERYASVDDLARALEPFGDVSFDRGGSPVSVDAGSRPARVGAEDQTVDSGGTRDAAHRDSGVGSSAARSAIEPSSGRRWPWLALVAALIVAAVAWASSSGGGRNERAPDPAPPRALANPSPMAPLPAEPPPLAEPSSALPPSSPEPPRVLQPPPASERQPRAHERRRRQVTKTHSVNETMDMRPGEFRTKGVSVDEF